MERVIDSFSRHAPGQTRLVIKNHPLDMGLMDYPRILERLAKRFGVEGRLDYLESGDLMTLLAHTRGVVTVNSTVGALALGQGRPVIALSNPLYALPGLTFHGGLDDFWRGREPPDAELFRRFRNVVIHATQVNGGFYSRPGIDLAIEDAARRIEAERSALEELL